jgi:hypothetical protein
MSSLQETLFEQLNAENLNDSDWLELIQRLLDYGVLCRDESRIEAELYDRFVRIEAIVDDYLALMGVRLHHDTRFQYVRLIPPGARVPGLEDETDTPFNGGLRARLLQHEVAAILALRAEYDKSLREGKVDESGCVSLSIEALALSLKNLLMRSLPDNQVDRRQLFTRLRQLRVIRYGAEADLLSGDSWIKIRPMVVHLVNSELLEQLRDGGDIYKSDDSIETMNKEPEDSALAHSGGRSVFAVDVDGQPMDKDE